MDFEKKKLNQEFYLLVILAPQVGWYPKTVRLVVAVIV